MQKTALNISVIGSDTLVKQGITDSRVLLDSIPGLKMNLTNPNAYIGLYGLASAGGSHYGDAVMAFNYGGVTLLRQTSATSAFYDLERVEVLKGPQGTLDGRNATVGAINVIPNRPTDEFGGGLSLNFGNYDTINTTGYLNIPLSEKVSSRVAFQTTRHDGYYSNGLDDANNYGLRASLKFEPSEDLTILLWGDIYRNRARGPYSTFQYYLNNTDRWINNDPWFGIGTPGSCTTQLLCRPMPRRLQAESMWSAIHRASPALPGPMPWAAFRLSVPMARTSTTRNPVGRNQIRHGLRHAHGDPVLC